MRFFVLLFSFIRNVFAFAGILYFFRLLSYPYSLQFVYIRDIIKGNKYDYKKDVSDEVWKTKNLFSGFAYMLILGLIPQIIDFNSKPILLLVVFALIMTFPFQLLLLPLPKLLRSKTYYDKHPLWAYIIYFFCFGITFLIIPIFIFL